MTFSHFDIQLPTADGSATHRVAVIFTPHQNLNSKAAAEELKQLFATAFTPKRVILIGMIDALSDLLTIASSDDLKNVNLPFDPKDIEVFTFDKSGNLIKEGKSDSPIAAQEIAAIRRQGMSAIFRDRGCDMKAGNSYHYVKPSGGHSKYFLRPGNAMRNGAEISFFAAWLLPYLAERTPTIYTDTSSITQIAYALIALAKRLGTLTSDPSIQSFSSYDGMQKSNTFSPEHEALVLISASTSGNLRKQAIENGASPKFVITLFSTDNTEGALCNLTRDSDNPLGITAFKTYKAANCPECRSGSLPIIIAGDSFLPETPEPSLCLLKRTDKPKWLDSILGHIDQNEVVRCFKPLGEGRNSILTLDLNKLCDQSFQKETFRIPLSRLISIDLDVIIHLPDNASKKLADFALSIFDQRSTVKPTLLSSADDLDKKLSELFKSHNRQLSALVISSCIRGGFSLLAVSRSLRPVASKIGYFIGIAMTPSLQAWNEFRSNLELRNDLHGRNPVELVWTAPMPRSELGEIHPWEEESLWLEEAAPNFKSSLLSDRLDILKNLMGKRTNGLINDAFLPAPSGKKLTLAPNFAFYKSSTLSQADVFFVITAILHSLRDSTSPEGLRQSPNSPVLLSPGNFDRYNDSVIQAALLRASFPSELAYASHPNSSRSISDLILRMSERIGDVESEAFPEFLLSLVTGRMTLIEADMQRLIGHFNKNFSTHEYLQPFVTSLASKYPAV